MAAPLGRTSTSHYDASVERHEKLVWIAYVGATLTFLAGIAVSVLGNALAGTASLIGGFLFAGIVFLSERIERVERRLLVEMPALQALSLQLGSDAPAAVVLHRASKEYAGLLTNVGKGRVPISNEEFLVEALVDLIGASRHTIDAVDRFALEVWLGRSERFDRVLNAHRAAHERGVNIVRVRLVDLDLYESQERKGEEYRIALVHYCELQKSVGVKLHLLGDRKLRDLNIPFMERGWMLVDQSDPARIAATYGLLESGVVREGALLFGESADMQKLATDFRRIFEAATEDSSFIISS